MNENKWNNVIMHLASFSLGVILTALMVSQGWFNEFMYVLGGSIFILFISLIYSYVRGIEYMTTNHPDYDGEDMYGEEETQNPK